MDPGKSGSSGSGFVEERFEGVFGVVYTAGVVTGSQCSLTLSSLAVAVVAALVLVLLGRMSLLLLLLLLGTAVVLAAVAAVLIVSWMKKSCLLEGKGECSSGAVIGAGGRGVCVHGPCDTAGAENQVLHSDWSACCSGCDCCWD